MDSPSPEPAPLGSSSDPAVELFLCARGTHRFRTVRTKLQKGPPYHGMMVCRDCPTVLSIMLAWKMDAKGYPKPYTETTLHVLDKALEMSSTGYRVKGLDGGNGVGRPSEILRVLRSRLERTTDGDEDADEGSDEASGA